MERGYGTGNERIGGGLPYLLKTALVDKEYSVVSLPPCSREIYKKLGSESKP